MGLGLVLGVDHFDTLRFNDVSGSYAVTEVFQKDFFLVRFDVSGSYAVKFNSVT